MGRPRSEVQQKLVQLLGSSHVYFQPPPSVKLTYPCFVYERSRGLDKKADDRTYLFDVGYSVTYISQDPENGMIERIMKAFPMISYDRHFNSDNLNHDVFILFY